MTSFQGIIRGRKIFYHTTRVLITPLPFYEEKRHIRRSLFGGRMDFRKEEDDSHWSHFVISTSSREYQTSTSLVPAALQWRVYQKKEKERKGKRSTRGEERYKWDRNRAISHAEHMYSAYDTLFFRRYFSEVDFFSESLKGGNIFTWSRLVVRDTT